ncbi:MAG: IS66 family insertion sequence element accessory protein TnpA [Cephaloticoccus sp.]
MATTTRKRREFTPEQRLEHVERFGRSGLSPAQFCRQWKLHPSTFSIWRRAARASAATFAEVQVSAPMSAAKFDGTAILHLPGGARLEVTIASDAVWHGLGVLLKSVHG